MLEKDIVNKINIALAIIWAVFLSDEFIRNVSSLYVSSQGIYIAFLNIVYVILIILVSFKMIMLRNHFWNYVFWSLLLIALWVMNSFVRGDLSWKLLLFIVAFYGIDYLKLAKIYLSTVGTCLFTSILLGLSGITGIRETDGGRFGVSRISLGTLNPNSCGAIILLLFCMWMIVYYAKKRTVWLLVIAEIINIGLFIIVQSLSFAISVSLGLLLLFLTIMLDDNNCIKKVLLRIISFGPLIVVSLSVVLGLVECKYHFFNPDGFTGTLNTRIIMMGKAFEKYNLSLFGTSVRYDNLGEALVVNWGDVFLLDNGWISILFNDGVVFLILFLCLLQIPSLIGYKKGNYAIPIVILMFSLEVFMEACCQVVIYGPIWVMLFSKYINYDREGEISV